MHKYVNRESYLRQVENYSNYTKQLFKHTIYYLEKGKPYGLEEIISRFQIILSRIGLMNVTSLTIGADANDK